jgi:5'-3' exonuclease
MFAESPEKAKNFYYTEKLKVDVNGEEGKSFKKRMLKRYIEGLQWVLYYYYKGA